MIRLYRSGLYVMLALTISTPALAKCYSFGVWSKEQYCYPDSADSSSDWIDPVPERLDLPFLDVLRAFEPITNAVAGYLALPAPNSAEELDQRVTDFFLAAQRENDNLVQGVERLETIIAGINSGIAEANNYIEANVSTAEILTNERDRLQAGLVERVAERDKWQARVAQLRDGANYFSRDAHRTQSLMIELITAVAPADSLLITPDILVNMESLWREFPPSPEKWPACCDVAPRAALEPEPLWRPHDRPLNVDLTAPRDVKISSLWQLSGIMGQNAVRLDNLAAEKTVRLAEFAPLLDLKNSMDSAFFVLRGQITTLENDNANAGQDVSTAQQESADARDKMVLSALQEWLWNSARDEMIIPETKAFLAANGFTQVAEKLKVDNIWESIQEVRNMTWSDAIGISGLDEFKAVQEKTIQLLNPTQSLILQSAEINAWATPAEGERFARTVFERLGDDAVEYFKAAGQVNVDEQYQGLLQKLLGDMDGTQPSSE